MPGPEPGQSWGILGGVFDPVHRGHLTLAGEMLSLRALDGILFVPADRTPHRQLRRGASFSQRCQMLQLALTGYPVFLLGRIEQEAGLSGYTLDTVRELKKRFPDVDFQFIIGADNLGSFKTWYHWEEVLREVRLLVGCRPGADPPGLDMFPEGRIDLVSTGRVDISSTAIREAVRKHATELELSQMVAPEVAEFIIKEGLYR